MKEGARETPDIGDDAAPHDEHRFVPPRAQALEVGEKALHGVDALVDLHPSIDEGVQPDPDLLEVLLEGSAVDAVDALVDDRNAPPERPIGIGEKRIFGVEHVLCDPNGGADAKGADRLQRPGLPVRDHRGF